MLSPRSHSPIIMAQRDLSLLQWECDGSDSDSEGLPSVEELLRTLIHNRTKLAVPDGNQIDNPTEGLDQSTD